MTDPVAEYMEAQAGQECPGCKGIGGHFLGCDHGLHGRNSEDPFANTTREAALLRAELSELSDEVHDFIDTHLGLRADLHRAELDLQTLIQEALTE